jgi:hypothetical protein
MLKPSILSVTAVKLWPVYGLAVEGNRITVLLIYEALLLAWEEKKEEER